MLHRGGPRGGGHRRCREGGKLIRREAGIHVTCSVAATQNGPGTLPTVAEDGERNRELALREWAAELELARRQWGVAVDDVVQQIVGGDVTVPDNVRVRDVALAVASANGNAAAVKAFMSEFTPSIVAGLRRTVQSDAQVQDLCQDFTSSLLLGHNGRPPLLRQFRGRSGLERWLFVGALRFGLRRGREGGNHGGELEQLAAEDDVELRVLRDAHRGLFVQAFEAAVRGLEARDRLVLMQHHIDGVPVAALAQQHAVHRVTMSRWLARARGLLLQATRDALTGSGQLSAEECSSLVRLFQSRFDISVARLLEASSQRATDSRG